MTKPEINVTPLIDVLLVLLIIFMIVSPTRPSSMDARIPSEPDNDPIVKNHPDTLVISVSDDLKLSLNNKQIETSVESPDKLIAELNMIFALRQNNNAIDTTADPGNSPIAKAVFIKAPRKISYGVIAKIVDAVKMAGADPVSLQIHGLN